METNLQTKNRFDQAAGYSETKGFAEL